MRGLHISITTEKMKTSNERVKRYCSWMTMFSTNPYFIFFQRFECYTTLIVKELLYNENQIFYFYFKKCRNLDNCNRNQHIK